MSKGNAPDEKANRTPVGGVYQAQGFALSIKSAKVATANLKDLTGDLRTGKSPDLIVEFLIRNNDERKILTFDDNSFKAYFRLNDDVGNLIRGVDYGITATPVGALTRSDDVQPGEDATHVELFSVPPPKTKFLVLTVDLNAFGQDGTAEFEIAVGDIDGFVAAN